MKINLQAFCLFVLFIIVAIESSAQVRIFVLAGQSNMQGQGKIYEGSNGAIGTLVTSFTPSCADPEAESCDFTFNMVDGYGDGWNGWTYDFVQDGVVVATETLPNGLEGTSILTLLNGVVCDVVVNNAGAYGYEISWTLTDQLEEVVASMNGQNENYPSPNTLLDVIENDEDDLWSMLQTDGEWTVFDNAFLYFENGQGTHIRDNVSIAQGANPELIGPELMFAHQMDEYYDDPVLIIKAAWGGLSLAEDFRPPSAGGTTGPYYTEMMEMVEYVTENLATEFPDLGTTEFELSGFAWFQGWNDAGSEDFLSEYESNLHHLIQDVRNDLNAPDLPIVVASSGQGGYEDHSGWMQDVQEIVAVAQENVACDDVQYGGTVGFVDTKPFYMDVYESPDDAGFHYHNNALSFLNIGQSIGEEMILAINDMAFCTGVTSITEVNGNAEFIAVYPNPASDRLTINSVLPIARIELFNAIGHLQQTVHQPGNQQTIDVSSFPSGIYALHITDAEDGSLTIRRMVVE